MVGLGIELARSSQNTNILHVQAKVLVLNLKGVLRL